MGGATDVKGEGEHEPTERVAPTSSFEGCVTNFSKPPNVPHQSREDYYPYFFDDKMEVPESYKMRLWSRNHGLAHVRREGAKLGAQPPPGSSSEHSASSRCTSQKQSPRHPRTGSVPLEDLRAMARSHSPKTRATHGTL